MRSTLAYLSAVGHRSYISILLMAYVSVNITAVRDAIRSLLQHIFSGSILFEHDPEEIYFWLSSLPIGARPLDAKSPEHSPLLNEQVAVVNFLDDCVQLCLKAPYGYIEEIRFPNSKAIAGRNDLSPLLATVLEQISYRMVASPLDSLSVVSFARRLLVRLSGKMECLGNLICLSMILKFLPISEVLVENHEVVAQAVRQEITMMENYLELLCDPTLFIPVRGSPSSAVADFLDRIENTSHRTTLCFLLICPANQRIQRHRALSAGIWPSSSLTVCASMVFRLTKK
jgi:nucleolar pre-ribosomal-associated protein 1